MLLRLMFVDRGLLAAGRKASVEGITEEKETAIKRKKRVRSMVVGVGGEGGVGDGEVALDTKNKR